MFRSVDGAYRVWYRSFFYFKKTWLTSAFWIVLEPLIYLGAIGYGLGSYVGQMQGQNFIQFFFPGLLCSTAMMVAYFEGTYSNFTKMNHQKLYAAMMLTPLSAREIIFGDLVWAATKGFFGVLGVSFIASLFGLVETWAILPCFLVLILVSWVFASFAMVLNSYVRNYDSFIFATSGLIVPMSLISGTYFPIETSNTFFKVLAYVLPLAHGVQIVRSLLNEEYSWTLVLHLSYLIVVGTILFKWSQSRLERKLFPRD